MQSANEDPNTKHQSDDFPAQEQHQPGLTSDTTPKPDHGESSYQGSGKLKNHIALITGGDSGIGRAVAIAYAREGADVAISYLPAEQDDAESTAALIREAGQKALLLPGDIRDEEQAEAIVLRTVGELGGLTLLVLNAAYQKERESIASIPSDGLRQVVETNLIAPVITARAAVPHLKPGSSIIVTSSVQATHPSPNLVDYAMTKAAGAAFTKALAEELGPDGIRVNAVAPGPIWTPLIPATGFDTEKVQEFGQDTPLGRAGQPAELAGAYVYLASEDASYTSGCILSVTGGKPF
ncbi:SDR family oxidoreductase [Humidisolicoccus flavus]|uniref:SDR family oxidoreductase n=1 Tax=Humidisolicoccus flavus TaxID=3111414 RepID=UPI00324E6E02